LKRLLLSSLLLLCIMLPTDVQPQSAPRNILVFMTDDQDTDSLPVMRKLLAYPEGSWIRFSAAYTNHSLCCPSRSTFLTGQWAHVHGVVDNESGDMFSDTNTLPVWLDNAGYETKLLGKYLNGYPWDNGAGYIPPGWDAFKENVNDRDITDQAIAFINTTPGPFFLYLGYKNPHEPAKPPAIYANADAYVPPDRPNYNEQDVSDKPNWVKNLPLMDQEKQDKWHAERLDSQRALLGVDDNMQSIVDALKVSGHLSNTMVIFLSDNGFSWGSHRYVKKRCAYEECSNFPLFIRYPGVVGNRTETRLVSNVDLASTVAEFAGVTPGLPQNGRSLIPLIENTAAEWSEEVLQENRGDYASRQFWGVRVPLWRYVEYDNGNKELYDLAADPYELQNQAGQSAYAEMQAQLAATLAQLRGL